jgi:hypothetical protein
MEISANTCNFWQNVVVISKNAVAFFKNAVVSVAFSIKPFAFSIENRLFLTKKTSSSNKSWEKLIQGIKNTRKNRIYFTKIREKQNGQGLFYPAIKSLVFSKLQ